MSAGILSGIEIQKQIKEGRIEVDPFNERHLNPASLDLTLGSEVKLYKRTYQFEGLGPISMSDGSNLRAFHTRHLTILDSKQPWEVDTFQIDPKRGWVLNPGIFYLMHTVERVTTNHYVPIIDGKSSVGRASIVVHKTAGYGDPGFDGQYTLEVTSDLSVRIYPGMRFCQMRFHTMVGEPLLYQEKGHYKGEQARGAVASYLYKQFD